MRLYTNGFEASGVLEISGSAGVGHKNIVVDRESISWAWFAQLWMEDKQMVLETGLYTLDIDFELLSAWPEGRQINIEIDVQRIAERSRFRAAQAQRGVYEGIDTVARQR